MTISPKDTQVFVLCGGLGTRLKEETGFRPKPMVPIGENPILWHIMQTYAHFGFRQFVLCLGYKADFIKSYFLNYASMASDFTVELQTNSLTVHSIDHNDDWQVTLAYTGESTMTGGRVARAARKYLGDATHFAVTYGDGVTDANLLAEFEFHQQHGMAGTVLGINPPSRFGELKMDGDVVRQFAEKPKLDDTWINGGYFFFKREFLAYLSEDEKCVLEQEPLVRLSQDQQLAIFRHRGFWQCMDTQRDRDSLEELWDTGRAPWAVWEKARGSV